MRIKVGMVRPAERNAVYFLARRGIGGEAAPVRAGEKFA